MNLKLNKNTIILALMMVAFGIWVFLFKDFFLGKIKLFDDGKAYYYMNYDYWMNMIQGVYPMWDPFRNWGISNEINLRFIGELNPIMALPMLLFFIGLPYVVVYFTYAFSYYFLGVVGFFLICKRIFKDTSFALIGFLMLLFSSLGINIFFNYCEIVIAVCSIWFFYFLLVFFEDFDKRSFLGLTFSLMLIASTYMPFYFLTVFLSFILIYILLYPHEFKGKLQGFISFLRKNKIFFLICLSALIVSFVPGVLWYYSAGSGDMIMNYRQANTDFSNMAVVGKQAVVAGGLLGPVTFKGLFSGLSYKTNELSYFFMPILGYIILLLSSISRVTKRAVICFFVPLVMLLISLAYSANVLGFLYEHVFYFKMIRNIYYLFQLAVPFLIIFIIDRFQSFLAMKDDQIPKRYAMFAFIVFMHIVFAVFLYKLGDIMPSSYISVIMSCIFFSLIVLNVIRINSPIFAVFLFFIVLFQPVNVFLSYCNNSRMDKSFDINMAKRKPIFSYTRSVIWKNNPEEKNLGWNESLGIIDVKNHKYSGSFWASLILKNVNPGVVEDYIKNKFIVYDNVEVVKDKDINWDVLSYNLKNRRDIAYISENAPELDDLKPKKNSAEYNVMGKDTDEFSVIDFNFNSIRFHTNFPDEKFLVYNDNYHSSWNIYINGKKGNLYRANVAFKGVFLKPGENDVSFVYGSPLKYAFIVLSFIVFYSMFVLLIISYFNSKVLGKDNEVTHE